MGQIPAHPSDAISAQGTYFGTLSDTPGSPIGDSDYGELAEVVTIGGPNRTSEEIDVTHLRSVGGYREFIRGFKDGGELPMELNYVPGSISQAAILAEFESGVVRSRRLFYPDGATSTFNAFVKGSAQSANTGAKLPLNVTFRVVGPIDFVPGGGSPAPA